MIILDYQDRRPLYEQIVEKFRTLILRGALPPESRLPSVRQLALELSINPNTIQRAYMELEQEGLIYPVKGRGNFVADSRNLQAKAREDYEKELTGVIYKGMSLGVTEEAMLHVIRSCFEGESAGSTENGAAGTSPDAETARGGTKEPGYTRPGIPESDEAVRGGTKEPGYTHPGIPESDEAVRGDGRKPEEHSFRSEDSQRKGEET